MGRTAVLGAVAAVVLAWSWLDLERGADTGGLVFWAIVLGVLPALAPTLRWRIAATALAAPLALREALGTARPGEAAEHFGDGFVAFYDVGLPFAAQLHPHMHGLLELGVFAFTLSVALAVAARKPLLAAALLVAGAGWPATLLQGDDTYARGGVILAVALALVAGVSATVRPQHALAAGAAVLAGALALGGIPAVAKGAFLAWEDWDPYRDRDVPVGVGYVWDVNFNPLTWPKRKTVVLRVQAPPVSRYWRATTLDVFNGNGWLEVPSDASWDPVRVPNLPLAADEERNLLRTVVTVEALQDRHLIATTQPVGYETEFDEVLYQQTGTATVQDGGGIPRGTTYSSFSYAPRPSPARLARSRPIYPAEMDRYLVTQTRTSTPPSPAFAQPGRELDMATIFEQNPGIGQYRVVYDLARRIVGATTSPYVATVRLEDHFRRGSYRYEEKPDQSSDGVPPIVHFLTRTRAGHCQYFASTMALMLRYLGIPSRVAAGFTSGRYDQETREWVVVDHDAHTWVEVWFRGIGWLPFDPTPGRGTLDGGYTSASAGFSLQAVTAALAAGGSAAELKLETDRFERGAAGAAAGRDVPGDIAGAPAEDEPSLLRLLALVAAAVLASVVLIKLTVRRARFLSRDPRRIAAACRRELSDFLADQRLLVPDSATPHELGEIVRHEIGLNPEPFVDAVEAARYGQPEHAEHEARRARRELRRLEKAIRKRLSPWDRARGVVSLRSFGVT